MLSIVNTLGNLIGLTAEYTATLKLYPKLGGYVDTQRSHMGTGYQFRVTYFKMLCRMCKSFRAYSAVTPSLVKELFLEKALVKEFAQSTAQKRFHSGLL